MIVMKRSFLTAALILAAFACLGWHDSSRLASTREHNSRLLAEAASLGITPDPANPWRQVLANRKRETRPPLTAAEYIAFVNEMNAKRKQGSESQLSEEESMKRVVAMMERLSALNADELKHLIAELRTSTELDGDARDGAVNRALFSLASNHPQAALAFLIKSDETLVDRPMCIGFIGTALSGWVKDDPVGAVKWVQQQSDQHSNLITDEVKRPLIVSVAGQDPKLAFQALDDLKFKDHSIAVASIMSAGKTPAARTDALQALREYTTGLTDARKRDKALGAGLSSLAEHAARENFQQGSQWIDSAKLSPAELQNLGSSISAHNIQTPDTGRWVEWLGSRVPSEKTSNRISEMIDAWTQKDYIEAGKWLNSTPDGPTKQAAVRGYVQAVAAYEPETAAQWAMTLPASKDRDRSLRQIYQKWPKNDPAAKAAAEAFADQHGIKR